MELKVGDFFTARTEGLAARLIRFGTRSPVNHAGIYVGNGQILEADPFQGFKFGKVSHYPQATWSSDVFDLTPAQRAQVLKAALSLKGIRYGWLDIAALSFAAYGVHSKIVSNRISKMNRLICSQAVDRAYQLADLHLFDDGRVPSDVTPGDLYKLLTDKEYADAVGCQVPRRYYFQEH